jgi:hypothetical protein
MIKRVLIKPLVIIVEAAVVYVERPVLRSVSPLPLYIYMVTLRGCTISSTPVYIACEQPAILDYPYSWISIFILYMS